MAWPYSHETDFLSEVRVNAQHIRIRTYLLAHLLYLFSKYLLCAIYLYALFRHVCSLIILKNITVEDTTPESLWVQSVYRILLSPRSTAIQGYFSVAILSPEKIQWDFCITLLLTNLLSQSYNEIMFSVIQRHSCYRY